MAKKKGTTMTEIERIVELNPMKDNLKREVEGTQKGGV